MYLSKGFLCKLDAVSSAWPETAAAVRLRFMGMQLFRQAPSSTKSERSCALLCIGVFDGE